MSVVVVENLVKHYGMQRAIDGITFDVSSGACFGSLGPNGAGKTTLIRILTGLIRATQGRAEVAGFDVGQRPDAVRRCIGVVSQAMTTDLDLSARENLDIYARYYGVPSKERKARIDELIERVGLASRSNDLVASYSGGMRRRLEIARGLIHKPKILFLDEPTIGLDPQSRRVVWDLLAQFRQDEQLTIFLTTHYMDEADFLCEEIAIIDRGKIVVMASPLELKNGIPGRDVVEMILLADSRTSEALRPESLRAALSSFPFVQQVIHKETAAARDGFHFQVYVTNGTEAIPILMQGVREKGLGIQSIGLMRPSLEDVFIHYTGRSIRSEEGQKVNFFIGAGVPRRMRG